MFHYRNYLRVRGEYIYLNLLGVVKAELPPRARRILARAIRIGVNEGTTSACAENTVGPRFSVAINWNYLRVRGEYTWATLSNPSTSELPPRARRIRGFVVFRG